MSRKGPAMGELMQRIEERARGLMADFDPYGASAPRELRWKLGPKRLDAARLRFAAGLGHFALHNWLPSALALAFLEPKVVEQVIVDPQNWSWPRTEDLTPEELVPLFLKLDDAGILLLSKGERAAWAVRASSRRRPGSNSDSGDSP